MPRQKRPKTPSIQQLPSGAYRAQIYIGIDAATGKKKYDTFTDRDESAVMHWAIDRMRDRDEARDVHSKPTKMTFGEALDEYIASKSSVLSPSSIREYKRKRKTCVQSLMQIPLNKIKQSDIQIAINKEAVSHSAKTVRDIHGLISAVLSVYCPDICLNTTLPQKEKVEIEIPTEDEIRTLLKSAEGNEIEIPLYLAACCAMRRSEICALKWSDINFSKNTISIRGAVVYDENDELVLKKTKTTAGTRIITMLPIVKQVLLRSYNEANKDSPLTALTPNAVYHRYISLLDKNGIRRYRFHSLRHYTVSVMLLLNVPKKYIADYVGHSSETMIDQVYGHIMKDKKASFTDQLNDYFSSIL